MRGLFWALRYDDGDGDDGMMGAYDDDQAMISHHEHAATSVAAGYIAKYMAKGEDG